MSAIVCFDIRNFSTHLSHITDRNKAKSQKIFEVVKDIFTHLDKEIKSSQVKFGFKGKTYVVHTGDGFVAIFDGKKKCLQGLVVSCLIGRSISKILGEYNKIEEEDENLKYLPPLDYGIGIHLGAVTSFEYQPVYSSGNKTHGIGLVGHAINLANRVQGTTKEHVYKIICTKRVFQDAISGIVDSHRDNIEKCFLSLGQHKLRGMRKPLTLYGIKATLALEIKPNVVSLSKLRH